MVQNGLIAVVVACLIGCGSDEVLLPVMDDAMGEDGEADADGESEGEQPDDSAVDADSTPEGDAPPGDGEGNGMGTDNPGVTGVGVTVDATETGPGSEVVNVADGDFREGDAPPPTSGGAALPEIVSVTGPAAVTNGGSAALLVTLAAPAERPSFVVSVDGDRGFHTVTGVDSNSDGIYEINVQVSGEAMQPTLVLHVAATDAAGNVGEYHEVSLELIQSGVGDVKITLSFGRTHDLDLHVFEPMGEEISFMNRASANGGQLDLDSGVDCAAGMANSENVFWPRAQAPSGTYRVVVHNYEECTLGDIEFSVRVAHDDQVITYRGTFASGTEGTAIEVVTFTR